MIAHVCAQLSRLLLGSGADGSFCLKIVDAAARAMCVDVNVAIGSDAALVTVGAVTRVGRRLAAGGVDMGRLDALAGAVPPPGKGPVDVAAFAARLDAIERATPAPRLPLTMLAVAATAGALARLFGGGLPVMASAAAAGAVGTLVRRLLTRAGAVPSASSFLIAFVSGLTAAAAMRLFPDQPTGLSLSAAGMVLVPGVPLVNGVRDLIGGHVGLALARLAGGMASLLSIGLGLLLASGVAGDALPVGQQAGHVAPLQDLVFSVIAVGGYAMLLRVPASALPSAAVCAALGHPLRTAAEAVGVDLAGGTVIGAFAAGILAAWAGRRHGLPAATFAFPGVVAMIPGYYGFHAGIGGLALADPSAAPSPELAAETLSLAMTTCLVTMSIAVGLGLAFSMTARLVGGGVIVSRDRM